jgi:hypothetical protein
VIAGVAGLIWETNKWVAMYLLLSAVSMLFPVYGLRSYHSFQAVLYGSLWFLILVKVLKADNVDLILDIICAIALLNVGMLILQRFNLDFMHVPAHGWHDPPVGLMCNQNFVSALLAISFPAFFRRVWVSIIPLVVLGLVLAKSLGGIFALGAGILVYTYLRGHYFLPTAIIIALLALAVTYVDSMRLFYPGNRWDAWVNLWPYYKQHWVMGAGLGHWIEVFRHYPLLGKEVWTHAHNEYIQAIFEQGVLVIPIFTGYIVNMIRKYHRKAILPCAGLVIVMVNSLVNFPMHIATTAMIAITWMALYEIQTKKTV